MWTRAMAALSLEMSSGSDVVTGSSGNERKMGRGSTVPDPAAVAGLTRSDPRGPGITRMRDGGDFAYLDASGTRITDAETIQRIKALAIPPGWNRVWISPDPLGHIQATGVDSRDRAQYRYHQLWREQRDEQKFDHMLRFAAARSPRSSASYEPNDDLPALEPRMTPTTAAATAPTAALKDVDWRRP
jgi:hypothetical protein